MITKQEMARRLRKSIDGADFLTAAQFNRWLGVGKNAGRRYLRNVPRFYDKYYMVEDVAEEMIKHMEVKR